MRMMMRHRGSSWANNPMTADLIVTIVPGLGYVYLMHQQNKILREQFFGTLTGKATHWTQPWFTNKARIFSAAASIPSFTVGLSARAQPYSRGAREGAFTRLSLFFRGVLWGAVSLLRSGN